MGDLTPQERLQPFLLDRLTDDDPESTKESRDKRVISTRQLRAGVLRDLAWLLNTQSFVPAEELDEFPEVAKSVINYGLRDLSGTHAGTMSPDEIRQMVQAAIQHYEPRILRNSLRIEPIMDEEGGGNNILAFEINADLWATPVPEGVYIKTEVDLETGQCELQDRGHG